MEEYAKAASEAVECLNFTWDSPVVNKSSTLPVLDTQLWVGEAEEEESIPEQCQKVVAVAPRKFRQVKMIQFKFYKKPMANKVPNRATNALPEKQKVTGSTQEVIRRLKNPSTRIPPSHIKEILKE